MTYPVRVRADSDVIRTKDGIGDFYLYLEFVGIVVHRAAVSQTF